MDAKGIAWRKFLMKNAGKLLIRGEEVSLIGRIPPNRISGGMIACSGDVQITGASNGVIVAGGDITRLTNLRYCIVICDGDVEMASGWSTMYDIIVARGKVTWKEGRITNCLIRSGHALRMPDGKTIDLRDGTPDPLAFVKFFELADVGLRAEDLPKREKSAADGVRLKEVKKDSPFAAGLRSGDVITAIEERKTPTTEILRRVLRRKLARGGPTITFTVRRSDKTFDVPIAVKD
jgi:hypothetical protein